MDVTPFPQPLFLETRPLDLLPAGPPCYPAGPCRPRVPSCPQLRDSTFLSFLGFNRDWAQRGATDRPSPGSLGLPLRSRQRMRPEQNRLGVGVQGEEEVSRPSVPHLSGRGGVCWDPTDTQSDAQVCPAGGQGFERVQEGIPLALPSALERIPHCCRNRQRGSRKQALGWELALHLLI